MSVTSLLKQLKKIVAHPVTQVLVSIGCMSLLVEHIEWGLIREALSEIRWYDFVGAVILCVSLVFPHALRWGWVIQRLGQHLSFAETIQLLFLGYLFNQVLPTSFGGDVIRAGCLTARGFTLTQAVHTVLVDRVFALLALSSLYVIFYPHFADKLPLLFLWVWLSLCGVLIGFGIFWRFQTFFIKTLSSWPVLGPFTHLLQDFTHVLNQKDFTKLFGISLFMHLCVGWIFYSLAVGLQIELSLWACLSLFPLINLATLIPLSFAGWGVREGVIVFVLSFLNIPSHQAFSLSVLYGIVITLTSIPGFYVWWQRAKSAKKELK